MKCYLDKLTNCGRFGARFLLPIPRVCSLSIAGWCDAQGATCNPADISGEVATVVRHPLDRLISAYHTRGLGKAEDAPRFWDMPFDQFVEDVAGCADVHVLPQSTLVRPAFFVRYESLATGWRLLCDWLGVPYLPLRHTHPSIGRVARDYFTPRTRVLAEAYYARDFEAFGYA
jgi:hypothetical protein